MFNSLDPETILTVLGCSFGSIAVGLLCGFFIGRWFTLAYEPRKLKHDRQRTLQALTNLMSSTDKLNEDVDVHNAALVEAERDISQIDANSIAQSVQHRLLQDVASMVESNRALENELTLSRFKLQKQAEELDKRKAEARVDALCQVGNRKAFEEAMRYMFSRRNSKGTSFALLLIDVDNFKRINDTFGHSAGDTTLVGIGSALKACVRPNDIVCRLGGDEFAVLLDRTTESELTAVGNRIRATIESMGQLVCSDDASTVATLSMGLTAVRDGDDHQSLYDRADEALYESKNLGRNRLTTRLESDAEDANEPPPSAPTRTYAEMKAELMGGYDQPAS